MNKPPSKQKGIFLTDEKIDLLSSRDDNSKSTSKGKPKSLFTATSTKDNMESTSEDESKSTYFQDTSTSYEESKTPYQNSFNALVDRNTMKKIQEAENYSSEKNNDRPSQENRTSNSNHTTIHIINNETRQAFQGRSASDSVTVAQIRWLANRRSQIVGFCLFVALLGLTIALYKYRWSGIIFGSCLTIICCSSVVYTYRKNKSWHQHPNPIVHTRSILDIVLACCLLCNIIVEYEPGVKGSSNCKRLAGFTEFFFFTSEAWALMMAFDLASSLMSPFANYKRNIKFYHLIVWTLGIIMTCVVWFVNDAAGFYRVDGQVISPNLPTDDLIGFCLASSRICCPAGDEICTGAPLCKQNNFFNTQKWPWFLVYIFVISVLVISVGILVFAWHRLYLRGVPKTYNIRLRVLNYISFFTGAYVFYWLLLLLLYMLAYFIASKEDENDVPDTSQVLRQIVVFVIAARGYLDYVIWFAVNSIKGRSVNNPRRPINRIESTVDADLDLSPQVNYALRSEILYYTTSGIKESSEELHNLALDQPAQEFLLSAGDKKDKTQKVKFFSYLPHTFRSIRRLSGISEDDYTTYFSATKKERFSEGRSGAFMFYTWNEKLIVKTLSFVEFTLLQGMAKDLAQFLTVNPKSLLTKFYGCHSVNLYGQTYYFVIMENIFALTDIIHYRYDIKGSWVDRNATLPRPGNKVNCRHCNAAYTFDSRIRQECEDGLNYHEPNIVLKDNDLLAKIRIDPSEADILFDQLCADSSFLCSHGIMDYSLLMGVQTCEYFVDPENLTDQRISRKSDFFKSKTATSVTGPARYHFGVIDFLQEWNFSKKMERLYKTHVLRKDKEGLSSIPPKPYMKRFQQKMAQIFAIKASTGRMIPEQDSEYLGNQPDLLEFVDAGDFFLNQRIGKNSISGTIENSNTSALV